MLIVHLKLMYTLKFKNVITKFNRILEQQYLIVQCKKPHKPYEIKVRPKF